MAFRSITNIAHVRADAARTCAEAGDLLAFSPFAPMRRLNVNLLLARSIDPYGSILPTRKRQRMDDPVEVQDADFDFSIW